MYLLDHVGSNSDYRDPEAGCVVEIQLRQNMSVRPTRYNTQ
jgi:hypothetical protein